MLTPKEKQKIIKIVSGLSDEKINEVLNKFP